MPFKRKPPPKNDCGANVGPRHKDLKVDRLSSSQLPSKPAKVPIELLQLLLNIFNHALFSHAETNVPNLIQQVKHYLFKRDFGSAFGRVEYLEAYALRWSPSRALAYTDVLCSTPILAAYLSSTVLGGLDHMEQQYSNESSDLVHVAKEKQAKISRIVCIGAGGGAEIVALGGLLKHLEENSFIHHRASELDRPLGQRPPRIHLEVTAIDIAEWDPIISKLYCGITTAPTLSQYASAETKATNRPAVNPSLYTVRFVQQDVLNMELSDLAATFADVSLVTLMFTLNELYSTSISATTNFLLSLTMLLSPSALLLVVDSPGSYSTVKLGSSSDTHDEGNIKKYPMRWLLDHTLLESAAVGSSKNASAGANQWEKLVSRESEWFRLPEGLVYPIDLEDMRYQVHLYRRL